MTTFVVTRGEYSDYQIIRVTKNLPEALIYIDNQSGRWDYRVESYNPEFVNSWYYKDDKLVKYSPETNTTERWRETNVISD